MSTAESQESQRWLRSAEEDLSTAERLRREGWAPARQVCFLAQQAAEKALKAALISRQQDFPYSHDLEVLRALLPSDWKTVRALPPLGLLSRWAVGARYPGGWPDPTERDAADATQRARRLLDAVRSDLHHPANDQGSP